MDIKNFKETVTPTNYLSRDWEEIKRKMACKLMKVVKFITCTIISSNCEIQMSRVKSIQDS